MFLINPFKRIKLHLLNITFGLILCLWSTNSEAIIFDSPIPRIEIGMHNAMINRIGVDATCTRLITGSDDKTVRVWAVANKVKTELDDNSKLVQNKLKLIQTIRLPLDASKPAGNQGKAYAVALSPDGKFIAVGGWLQSKKPNKWSLYIYNARTGKIVHYLDDVTHRIVHLAFSGKGHFLVGTFNGKYGISIWQTSDWSVMHRDADYKDASYGAAFDNKDGSLYTLSVDGILRHYDPNFNFLKMTPYQLDASKGKIPYHISVNPKNKTLAIGYAGEVTGTSVVDIYSTTDMKLLMSPSGLNLTGSVGKVAWSSDGQKLFAGGRSKRGGKYVIRTWSKDGLKNWKDIKIGLGVISHLLPCGDDIAFSTRDPAFGLVSTNGEIQFIRSTIKPDWSLRKHRHLTVSKDARRVRFDLGRSKRKLVIFDLSTEHLSVSSKGAADLFPADKDSIPVDNWENVKWGSATPPSFEGKILGRDAPLNSRKKEMSRSFAAVTKTPFFISGSEWRLRKYDSRNVEEAVKEIQIPGDAHTINVARNGRVFVVAHDDGTIRWYKVSDLTELLALYVNPGDLRWIAWTPKGYFMSSIGGEDLIGWQVNRGYEKATEFYQAHYFRYEFYRPSVVQSVLATLNIDEAIKNANSIDNIVRTDLGISDALPPSISFVKPKPNSEKKYSKKFELVNFKISIPTGSDLEVTDVLALVDGITVKTKNVYGEVAGKTHSMYIKMPESDADVTLVPYFRIHGSTTVRPGVGATISYVWDNSDKPYSIAEKPNLHALLIGLHKYKNFPLNWASKDAIDLQKELSNQLKIKDSIYRGDAKDIKILTDISGQKNRNNILSALDELASRVRSIDSANNVTIVFYSGHGFIGSAGGFFLLPSGLPATQNKENNSIPQSMLFEKLKNIPGRKILILDACRSGTAAMALRRTNIAGIMNAIRNAPELNVFAYASTESGEFSVECKSKNGCFTAAILNALKSGKAALFNAPKKRTDTDELRLFVNKETLRNSKDTHKPVMIKSNDSLKDFEIFSHE